MQYIERLIFLSVFLFAALSCENRENQAEKNYFIEWDNTSLVCIADEGGYPRLIKLDDESLLAVYENRKGDVVVKKSFDNGSVWSDEVTSFEAFNYTNPQTGEETRVNIANPEIIQLADGDLLLAVNLRPRIEGIYPFSIALKRSSDNGATWSDAEILFQAAEQFRDGCWEPSFLLLPDGTIQIYFANEYPYQQSDEQEISVLTSYDNGFSWESEPKTVSFRKGHRDGMPMAVHDGESVYVVIEDNVSGQFKPWIISGTVNNSWDNPVLADSPDRYSALKNNLPDTVYAGAPYMIRTNSGIYLISYQTTENRSSNWELSTMEVVVSHNSFDFRNPTQPFNVPLNKEAKWNSLSDIGNNTIAALASTNFNSEKIGVWMIKGKIVFK
ncbi:MAG: sialidase family protein [Fermentimonas sp.]|nr:sialidase family protein [Fermentimonas sp.]